MSCDTFVALPPATNGCIIFAKNSDRPSSEVQEVIYQPGQTFASGSKLQCTYLEIPQAEVTASVILSKPAWMWGAEMGANQHGVCIGNEAVWTKLGGEADKEERLLGMDLVRLGLERGKTAKEALDVITQLLEEFGQGGPCYEDRSKSDIIYHNSFLIADGSEAWVLETAARHWAAERITGGVRNISNLLSIGSQIYLKSAGLLEEVKSAGFWSDAEGDFNFAKALAASPPSGVAAPGNESPENRFSEGRRLLEGFSAGALDATAMMSVLRNEESGICRVGRSGGSVSTGSQVSVLYPPGSGTPSTHWFTATPNPRRSVFKPFFFTPDVAFTALTASPSIADDPAKTTPRFQREVDRRHALYKAHQKLDPLADVEQDPTLLRTIEEVEAMCIQDVEEFIASYDKSKESELSGLFTDIVESEIKFYGK